MPRVPLLGGAYQSRAIIASAQRSINLYPEVNEDEQAPAPVTHFPTPGLTTKGTPPTPGIGRCVFRASNGNVYEVVDGAVYYVDNTYFYTLLGSIPVQTTPVIMKDNGLAIVIVDGTSVGYAIKMSDNSFAPINDPNFLGGTYVDYMDTYFIFNTPGLNEWQISLSLVTFENLTAGVITAPALYAAFDPLDVASKTGSPDPITGVICMHRNLWTPGTLTTEVWYNSGAADFTFSTLPGVYIEHGCAAPYSLATTDLSVFWLAQDRQGKAIVLRGDASFQVKEISSKGIEAIISGFPVISDAIGGCYQLLGHGYYVLTFPTANRTFACELKTNQWHELAYTGPNGFERHRSNSWCFGYGLNLTCDRQNGNIYQLDPTNFTDFGNPITRLRTIPHLLNEGKRIRLDRVIADTQGGTLAGSVPGPYSQSIQALVQGQALTVGLKLMLEAGNLPSWQGVGQKWQDESGGGYDFYLGPDGTGSNDPTFNGTLGGQSLNEYWGFNGTEWFTYDSANEAWMNAIHQAGAQFTIFTNLYIPNTNTAVFIGTGKGGASNAGFIAYTSAGLVRFQVFNGSSTIYQFSAGAVVAGAWNLIAISLDVASGAGFVMVNGVASALTPSYPGASAGAAGFTMHLASDGNAALELQNGARMAFMTIWQGVVLTSAQMAALSNAVIANNQLPSPLLQEPQIFLRISYDRGGSFSDALPARFGAEGDYGEFPWWPNLGLARDFVLELSWSAPINTALNGIFYDATPTGA